MSGPAAYSLYDLFRALIERSGWPTEDEKKAALASVDQAEKMNIFGNLATAMACEHPEEALDYATGICRECNRQIIKVGSGPPRYQRGMY